MQYVHGFSLEQYLSWHNINGNIDKLSSNIARVEVGSVDFDLKNELIRFRRKKRRQRQRNAYFPDLILFLFEWCFPNSITRIVCKSKQDQGHWKRHLISNNPKACECLLHHKLWRIGNRLKFQNKNAYYLRTISGLFSDRSLTYLSFNH